MKNSPYENSGNASLFAAGALKKDGISTAVPLSNFVRMAVLEVISDPNGIVDQKKIDYWSAVLKVSNIRYANILPRNTIIAQALKADSAPMFLFPFFPSHLAMPCKPGEFVWVMFENPLNDFTDMAYWFSKITEPHIVDDVNHTHTPRIHEPSYTPNKKDLQKTGGIPDVWTELRNGPVGSINDSRTTVSTEFYIHGTEDIFEKLVTETDASKLMQYEAVPRFRKRPGDIALEGTNNSLIVLGTDRVGAIASYKDDVSGENKSLQPTFPVTDLTSSAGSIDIVVGRGQRTETFGKEVATTSIVTAKGTKKGAEIKKELSKAKDDLQIHEGDPDPRNDRSRILVSQRTMVDKNFGLDSFNSKFSKGTDVSDGVQGDAAIVIKTDKVRLIARSDVEILVTGFTKAKSAIGKEIKDEKDSTGDWAAIVIKSNGDIVFKPSKSGYIKLGGDDADKGLVCTSVPVVAVDGGVSGAPLTTTMGGQFAGSTSGGDANNTSPLDPTKGKFANKVLVK